MPTERLLYLIEAEDQSFTDGMKRAAGGAKMTEEQLEAVRAVSKKMETDLAALGKAVESGLITPGENATKEMKVLEKGLQDMLSKGVNPSHAGFQRYQAQLSEMRVGLGGMQGATGSAAGAQTQLLRIIQQAPRGMTFMGDNIARLAEHFQGLTQESGGAGAAISQLLKSIGPGGWFVLGIAAATTAIRIFGPKLREFLQGGAADAEELAKGFEKALKSLVQMGDVFSKFKVSGEVAAEAVGQIDQEMESLLASQRANEQALSGLVAAQERGASGQAQRIREQQAGIKAQITELESERKVYQDIVDQVNRLSRAEEIAARRGFERVEVTEAGRKSYEDTLIPADKLLEIEREISYSLVEQARHRQKFREERRKALFGDVKGDGIPAMPDDLLELPERLEIAGIRTEAVMADFGSVIAAGLANATTQLIAGSATFGEAFGGLLSSLGQGLIGAGIAGIAIKAFIKDPVSAIVAGTALVALGAHIAQSSQKKVDRFTASGGAIRSYDPQVPARAAQTFGVSASPPSSQRVMVVGKVSGRTLELVQVNQAEFDRAAGRVVTS